MKIVDLRKKLFFSWRITYFLKVFRILYYSILLEKVFKMVLIAYLKSNPSTIFEITFSEYYSSLLLRIGLTHGYF